MSEFIKFSGPTGTTYVRRNNVRSVDAADGSVTVSLEGGVTMRGVTDPLPAIEAALGYREHPAVADLARHKIHLDNIRCDLADAGIAIPADDDPELTPREMVKALIAEVVALRGRVASAEVAAPAFVPAKVGDRWGDLTEAQIRALPEGTVCVSPMFGEIALKANEWRYTKGEHNHRAGARAGGNEPDSLVPDNVITHIPAPAAAPTPKPGDVVTVEIARALPVGAVVEWDAGPDGMVRATKTGGNAWSVAWRTGSGTDWEDDTIGHDNPPTRLVSLPTPSPNLPAPGTLLHTLTDADLDRLPEGSRFVADESGWHPLVKHGKEWRFRSMDADMEWRRVASRERANYRLHLPSGAE